MKISREWLQTYFDTELPSIESLADALTFHSFEIDGIENDVLDVKVTPNRGHDCLSYEGMAKEVSAILGLPVKNLEGDAPPRPMAVAAPVLAKTKIQNTDLCSRYMTAYIKGVKIGESPDWLVSRLSAMGQHSINNIVDATNYIMFATGQPLHAFDVSKLTQKDDGYVLSVRGARANESIVALDGKNYELREGMLVIADYNSDRPIGVAGVKGGMACAIDNDTQDIILESANFDGVSVRRTAQALKIRTDSSVRFEQQISPTSVRHGMEEVIKLIIKIAGGELLYINENVAKELVGIKTITVSIQKINSVLGTDFSIKHISDIFSRLGFRHTLDGNDFSITVPTERLDIFIAEDLIEEIGRISGYENVPAVQLPTLDTIGNDDSEWLRLKKIRGFLISQGFFEVFTSTFAERGERLTTNKVDGKRPFLRDNLATGLSDALERNVRIKEILGSRQVKIFEIGTVWRNGKEEVVVELAVEKVKGMKSSDDYVKELDDFLSGRVNSELFDVSSNTKTYQPFSRYPYIIRDIALWVPQNVSPENVREIIETHSGELATRVDLFDTFTKDDKISYAFRIIFQSMDRTLFEGDANERMENIYREVRKLGWVVR